MKDRILVAVIGLPVLIVVLLLCPDWATALLVAAICGFACREILWKTGCVPNFRIPLASILMSVLICVWSYLGMPGLLLQIGAVLFAVYLFMELIFAKLKVPFENLCVAMFAGVVIPFLLSAVARIRGMENGVYFVLSPFVMTMVPDAGAFFAGRRFGRRKLAPEISPHKTVEGVIGGLISGVLGMMLYGFILSLCGFRVHYLLAALYGALGTVLSVLGDLVFSVIKRQHGIKDFSSLFPGHGGVLDRFDSMIPVAPAAELLLRLLPFAVK